MDLKDRFKNHYLIYARKSTNDANNQQNSIAYQIGETIRYAKNQGLQIAAVEIEGFCRDGIISERHTAFKIGEDFVLGKNGVHYTIERPKFYKLIQFLLNRTFKGVIFLCWDRASRNKTDNDIIERLINKGIDVKFVQANYEKSSSGQLHMDMDGSFAHHYSRVISEKVRNTTRKLREEGVCTYKAPIGYLNPGSARNKPFDEERSHLVKELFEKYEQGTWSISDLRRWAANHGLTMPPIRRRRTLAEFLQDDELNIEPVSRPLTDSNIHTILTNPFYIGQVLGNDGMYVKSVSHAPLISESLFYAVQQQLKKKNVSVHYMDKLYYPYRGLVRCAECNRVYSPYEQKGIHYYGVRCANKCSNRQKNIREDYIETSIGDIIKSLSFSEQELSELSKIIQSEVKVSSEKAIEDTNKLDRLIRKIGEDLEYLNYNKLLLLKTGTYTPEAFTLEQNTLNDKLQDLKTKLANFSILPSDVIEDVINLSELLKDLYSYYILAIPPEKREVITFLFSELRFSENNVIYQSKNGFRVLENRLEMFGSPNTWITELFRQKDEVSHSLSQLKTFLEIITKSRS